MQTRTRQALSKCIKEINQWVRDNFLQLNKSRYNCLWTYRRAIRCCAHFQLLTLSQAGWYDILISPQKQEGLYLYSQQIIISNLIKFS